MVRLLKARGIRVLLIGMRMPPNYGPRYTAEFTAMFRTIAARDHVPLVPFLLEGVATDRALMQQDDLHPNELGQPRLLDNVWPRLRPLLHASAPPRKAG
jgi:acyl-CoA thioesterase-1